MSSAPNQNFIALLNPTTCSFTGGRLPGLIYTPETNIANPPLGQNFSGSLQLAVPPPLSQTWNFAIQAPAIVPRSPTLTESSGRFSIGAVSLMEVDDPNRHYGGMFIDPAIGSPKTTAVQPMSNNLEDDLECLLANPPKPPYPDYVCNICNGEAGFHWIKYCPRKNLNPETPYQGDRKSKGKFECSCGNSFYSESVYANSKKKCYRCGMFITPKKMWPLEKDWSSVVPSLSDYRSPHYP